MGLAHRVFRGKIVFVARLPSPPTRNSLRPSSTHTSRALEYLRVTYGWCLMLIVVSCVLYFRYLDAKAEGRLDDGIDPQWMKDVPPRQPVPA